MTLYLATSFTPAIRDAVASGELGRLCTPSGGSPPTFGTWGADSGCFTLGDRFVPARYLNWLEAQMPHKDRCLFAPAPDVVGDHAATVIRSAPYLPAIRAMGYPAAFVGQDGATPANVPWNDFDVLFLGGTTEWKLGRAARLLCFTAVMRGKPVHVGRVNSGKRFRYARDLLHAASADGTFLSFGPTANLPRLRRWAQVTP